MMHTHDETHAILTIVHRFYIGWLAIQGFTLGRMPTGASAVVHIPEG